MLSLRLPAPSSSLVHQTECDCVCAVAEHQRAEELLKKKILGLCIQEQSKLQVTSGAAHPSLISPHEGDLLTVEQPVRAWWAAGTAVPAEGGDGLWLGHTAPCA